MKIKFSHNYGSASESEFDIIVFPLSQDLALTSEIAKSISTSAGTDFETNLKAKAGTPKPSDAIVLAKSGTLKSKQVIAIIVDENNENLKKGIKNALAEA